MGLEITRKKDGTLRSKYWYGRFEVNGQSKTVSLNVEIKGRVPETLRKEGDIQFERSRVLAQVKLDELTREARSHKAAEKHLQDLYELKAGDALHNEPLTALERIWDELPTKKTRSERWIITQHNSLKAFREFVTQQHPQVTTMPQVTRSMALAWMRKLDEKGFGAETYNHKLILLRSVFNPSENTGVLRNPFDGIPPKRKTNVHREPFTEEELSTPHARYLLADEVGLGKTIEAGLVIKELKMRGRIRRTLIIAPKGLVPQWIVEMRERFGEEFRYFAPSDFEGFRQISGEENVWRSYDQVICSMDAVKPLDTRRGWSQEKIDAYNQDRILGLSSAGWDLVIIDESHRVAGSADTVARHKMARMVAESAPHLLLLSATPHQGKTDSFHRLMALLSREAFPDPSTVDRDRVQPYVVRTEKRNAIDNKGLALFKPRLTKLIPIPWGSHGDQQQLYDAVTEYVREGYNQALSEKNNSLGFLMILMQRLVTSSTNAIAASLERRLDALRDPEEQLDLFSKSELEELNDQDGQSQLDAVLKRQLKALKNERAEVELLYEAAKRVMARGPDAKAEALLDWIYKLQQEEADPEMKVLIFTEFVPTQKMLAEYLEQSGFSVVCLNGSLDMDERKAVQKRFSKDARIMISTDAGGEGLNLQFCHIIINFDLGWRPMALEQRIGRVDRIGQKHVVKALNFVLEDSVEFRIREVLEAKLSVIFAEFGIDKTSDVLDSEEGAHMFDKLFIDALLNPDKIEDGIEEVTATLQAEAGWNRERLNVLCDTDAEPFSVEQHISTQPLSDYLDILVRSHVESLDGAYSRTGGGIEVRWPGEKSSGTYCFVGEDTPAAAELLTMDHPRIRNLLAQVPRFIDGDPIPSFSLGDLPGKVGGTWSLWHLRFPAMERVVHEFFPVFLQEDGRSFDRTASFLWERLPGGRLAQSGLVTGADAERIFRLHVHQARKTGLPVYERLKAVHNAYAQEKEANGRFHYDVRLKQLNDIGLKEVRQFRQRQLELEQAHWRSELEQLRKVTPEINPLIVLHLQPE